MTQEKTVKAPSGYLMLIMLFIFLAAIIFGITQENPFLIIPSIILIIITIPGFILVNPNTSKVLLLFGKYMGTIKENGFYWGNPL